MVRGRPGGAALDFVTHEDGDHCGNLAAVLARAPNARVVLSFLGTPKIGPLVESMPERLYIVNAGQSFDAGDRRFQAILLRAVPDSGASIGLPARMLRSGTAVVLAHQRLLLDQLLLGLLQHVHVGAVAVRADEIESRLERAAGVGEHDDLVPSTDRPTATASS